MTHDPLRIGLIGAGAHCSNVLLPLIPHLPVTLAAVCDRDAARCHAAADRYGAAGRYGSTAEMYARERLDAVLICVGPQAHPGLAGEALAAGLHVWVEKPIAHSVAEIDGLIARRHGKVVVVGFKKAFMPGIRRLRELIARPAAGRLLNLVGEYPVALPPEGRSAIAAGRAGGWLANGCHPLAAMLALGGRVEQVTSQLNAAGYGVVTLGFANGALGSLNLLPLRGVHDRYAAFSEHGHAEVENGWTVRWHRGGARSDRHDFTSTGDAGGTVTWEPDNAFANWEARMEATQGFRQELEHFLECIAHDRPAVDGSLEFARHLQQVWDAALDSCGTRVVIAKAQEARA